MANGVREREGAALLTTPVFLASVVVLVANDHMAKGIWSNALTGKLSDVAGVAMVAIIATAILRRVTPACVLVVLGFTALKTLPFVADAAVPLLGGRTLTDATDLLALVVLVPLWRWLKRAAPEPREHGVEHRVVLWGATAIKVTALTMAAVATSATSCPPVGVEAVAASGDRFVVATSQGMFDSGDGGTTWQPLSGESDLRNGRARAACVDEVCFEIRDSGGVVRIEGGEVFDEFVVTDEQFENLVGALDDTCSFESSVFAGIAAVELDDGANVVVAMGEYGVLQRDGAGEWTWRTVGSFDYDGQLDVDPGAGRLSGRSFRAIALAVVGLAVIGGIGAGVLSIRRRHSLWWAAFQALVGVGAMGVVVFVVFAATFLVNPDRPRGVPYSALWWFVPPMFGLAVVVGMVQWLARPRREPATVMAPPAPPSR